MSPLGIVRTRAKLREQVTEWRAAGLTVGLAPTMGALHEGHLSLVRLAKDRVNRVVASVFVNPTQFAPHEDFEAYPREEDADAEKLTSAGCDLLYAPTIDEIYPRGFNTTVTVDGVSAPMEGEARPTHFAGVATVVAKLLIQCMADVAVFGEKDFQQLQVIRRLALDLDLPTEIVGAPIVRDSDGLALSSRNAYLAANERVIAPWLYRSLRYAAQSLSNGAHASKVEEEGRKLLLNAGFHSVDYFEVRHPDDLRRLGPGPITGRAQVLATARLGRTRLLDNLGV